MTFRSQLFLSFLVQCGEVTDPDNGTITLATNGSLTMATLACGLGFTLSGSVEVKCGADGTWSYDVMAAECGSLSSSANKLRSLKMLN